MELEMNIAAVLSSFGLGLNNFLIQRIDSGHINHTYKLGSEYIFQRINKNVFLQPEILSDNLNIAADFLSENSPQYLLPRPIKNNNNEDLIFDQEGYPWRLFPYIKNTFTINEVANVGQAYAVAKAFGELTKLLSSCHTGLFKESIPDFHNLSARFLQFEHSLSGASSDRLRDSEHALSGYTSYKYLVEEYEELVASNRLILRIMHNDTKINNVLFRQDSNEVVCV
ncbi:MAG: phosphotransferase, partial [Cyclobacteriaceae bacterium]